MPVDDIVYITDGTVFGALRGPAGLKRGDLMDKWKLVSPKRIICRHHFSTRRCLLCKSRIVKGQSVRVYEEKRIKFITHDDCFYHYAK